MNVAVIFAVFVYNFLKVEGAVRGAHCYLKDPSGKSGVHGVITIYEASWCKKVLVIGRIYGLTPGLHGFHVHRDGNIGNDCKNAGPHFNPYNQQHGAPYDQTRHVGDLGNIKANGNGTAKVWIFDPLVKLYGPPQTSVLGRGIVNHWVDATAGGLLVPESIHQPSSLVLRCWHESRYLF